jgi:hypothetical protein
MRRALTVPVLALALACAGSNTGPDPNDLSLAGKWRQSGDLRDAATGDSHIHLGTFTLRASGDSFAGSGEQSGTCSASGHAYAGPLSDPTAFAVTNGLLQGRTVTFQRDICTYQGAFLDGRNDRITGTATCAFSWNGVQYRFEGQWQADKLP